MGGPSLFMVRLWKISSMSGNMPHMLSISVTGYGRPRWSTKNLCQELSSLYSQCPSQAMGGHVMLIRGAFMPGSRASHGVSVVQSCVNFIRHETYLNGLFLSGNEGTTRSRMDWFHNWLNLHWPTQWLCWISQICVTGIVNCRVLV